MYICVYTHSCISNTLVLQEGEVRNACLLLGSICVHICIHVDTNVPFHSGRIHAYDPLERHICIHLTRGYKCVAPSKCCKPFPLHPWIHTCIHGWSGKGLQHLLGATKRAFSFFYVFWNSDYRQRFPLKSTEIWRYRKHLFYVLKFPLSPLHYTRG